MPQILKNELREKIIIAACDEFYKKGYERTSLRVIAKNSGMTVGNLYRYYENKKDILDSIVMPVIEQFDSMLVSNTDNYISMHDMPKKPVMDFDSLKQEAILSIDNMTVELARIFMDNPKAILLLSTDDDFVDKRFAEWYRQLIRSYMPFFWGVSDDYENNDILLDCYSQSILKGIQLIMQRTEEFDSVKELAELIRRYIYLALRID